MLVLLLGGTLLLVNHRIRNELRTGAAENLETASAVFQNSQQIRIKNLVLRLRSVPNEPRFKAVSQLGDVSTFRVLLTELLSELGVDAAMFTTREGESLAAASRQPAFKLEAFADAGTASIQQAAESGQPAADMIGIGPQFFDVVSVPCRIGNQLLGVVTFAVEMGESVAQEFKQLTHTEILFRVENRFTVSTLDVASLPMDELIAALTSPAADAPDFEPDSIQEFALDGEHFLAASGRLPTLDDRQNFSYVLLSSFEPQLRVLHSTQQRIALIGLVGILVSGVMLWVVIRGLTNPLRQLRDAADKIGSGDFSRRVIINSKDECGDLAKVFNQMTANLDASRTQLQEAHDHLELRVEERTMELTEAISRRERADQATIRSMGLLQATLESTADGILTVGSDERIESFNQRFIEMWRIPDEVIAERNDDTAIQFVLDQLLEPDAFIKKIRHLKEHPMEESFDTLDFNDGRAFERFSRAMLVDGTPAGRVWSFRDITSRKQSEAKLEKANRDLVEASRTAGMAEVATGVLHNVGNVLNTVNLTISEMRERLDQARLEHLRQAVTLLNGQNGNLADFLRTDTRGKTLLGFLAKVTDHLEDENQALRHDAGKLVDHVDHIKEIVSTQQSYAKVMGIIERIPPAELIEAAIELSREAYHRHGIEIVTELADLPPVPVDRHKIIQILVNLLNNAKDAIKDGEPGDRHVLVQAARGEQADIAISVTDHGVGINPENLQHIFQHGFTTKPTGHGFGLHSSALAAGEMGGTLNVTSDGVGRGATFTLTLPTAEDSYAN